MRVGRTRPDDGARRRSGTRLRMRGVLVPVDGGAVMMLAVLVIVVQVDVQQRQRQVADDQDDTGENSGNPMHVARVYPTSSKASSGAKGSPGRQPPPATASSTPLADELEAAIEVRAIVRERLPWNPRPEQPSEVAVRQRASRRQCHRAIRPPRGWSRNLRVRKSGFFEGS